MRRALIIVDVQRDFCAGGALPATDTSSLIEPLAAFIEAARQQGALIVFTQDWHPSNHGSFVPNGGRWPVHCVSNSRGAELMPPLSPEPDDLVVQKGVNAAAAGDSAFEATGLNQQLRSRQVTEVAICGIATEVCVRATALDAARAGFSTTVLTDLVRAVSPAAVGAVFHELRDAELQLLRSLDWSATGQT